MIRYAELDENSRVINIIVATEAAILSIPGKFIKMDTSSNPLRKETCIGGEYNLEKDMFVLPQPWPSWVLDEDTLEWHSPIGDKPNNDKKYNWNEEDQEWQEIIPITIDL
jgi:hypothetical protein